ncbi:H-NS family nucleoid-associated regulatory protein [Vibrio sp. 10N.261.45.F1]|uniref:H-NS family histone-like protein n=1 Tax=unclassified Vibrio TaxID=2614977 RepID=UPI0035506968
MSTDVSLTEQLLAIFANKKRTQQTFKATTLSHLKTIHERLGEHIEQREKAESEKMAAQEEAKAMLKSIMEKTGLSHEEVYQLMNGGKPKSKNKRPKRAKKTPIETQTAHQEAQMKCYTFGDGRTWDGVGEVPQELQSLLDEGFELSDFLAT